MVDRLATVLAGYAPAAREAARSTLAGALEYSFTAGENPLVAARTISRQFAGITYTRAATIARTEMAVAGWDGAQADYAADPVVKAWQWMATFDGNACEICTTMHGTEYPTSDRLESHPNCRCTMVPVTDNFRPIGAGETGVERMQGMSEADLLRIWGPGRTALIRGGMNPMDLIGSRRHAVFGRQPVLKPLRSLRQPTKRPTTQWDEARDSLQERYAQRDMLTKHFGGWDELTEAQREALSNYQASSYRRLNAELREGTVSPLARTIDSTMKPLPSDTLVWRGVTSEEAAALLQPGATVRALGFQSTSMREQFAKEWGKFNVMKITVQQGTGARWVAAGGSATEAELLLQRGVEYFVTRIEDFGLARVIHVTARAPRGGT